MREAIRLSRQKMRANQGGPFGAIIVKGDKIVGRGWNRVPSTNDPTAHAEIVAIRDACKRMNLFHLAECEIYTSCEPCPMCMGAIYWARLRGVYYANTREDAASIGFDDDVIFNEIRLEIPHRKMAMKPLLRGEALKVFGEWKHKDDKIRY